MAGPARDASYADYSSTSNSKFIPEVWAGKLVTKFYGTSVFGEISNTDYEGEIQALGDNIIIRTRPNIAINDYTIGAGLTYETPESDSINLPIDKAKSFTFKVNSIDKYQSDLELMNEFTDDATEQMQIEIDKDVLGNIYGDVAAENAGTTAGAISGDINLGATDSPIAITKDNVLDKIVDIGTILGEQNVPRTGRWIVIPEWMAGLIKKSDLKDASLAGDETSILRNGRIGMIDAFTVYASNNLSVVNDPTTGNRAANIVAGHKAGLAWASQMTNMEDLPNPNDFGQLVRGLNVYGYKVIEGKYLAHLYAEKG